MLLGGRFRDAIKISGLEEGHGAEGTASLYGPFESRAAMSCTDRYLVKSFSFNPQNGVQYTPWVTPSKVGYYTWMAETTKDSHNKAASHKCGVVEETGLVHKKQYVTPHHVSSGFAGTLPSARVAMGESLRFGRTKAKVLPTRIRKGNVVIPGNTARVGRLAVGAAIDDAVGTTVVVGHVSDRSDRPGAMYNLKRLRKGSIVSYTVAGKVHRFKVTQTRTYRRGGKLPADSFSTTGAHKLVLITCTDRVVYPGGRFHYRKNLFVTAVPIS